MLKNIQCFISSFFVNTYVCNSCRIVIVLVMCVYDMINIVLIHESREEHTQNLGIRGRAFGYQKPLTCMSTIIVGILVLILRLSCQIISLIYKGFISLELYSLFPHYIPLTVPPLDYLYKKTRWNIDTKRRSLINSESNSI